ncbi:MAG: chromosome partitioning protein [Acidimicrobiia bacterium]
MSLVVVMGGKEAPGATTTALALACTWPAPTRQVVEADPDGGVMAARFGLSYEPGLVSLAALGRRDLDGETLTAHTQVLGDHGLALLAAPALPEQVAGALAVVAAPLAEACSSLPDAVVTVDVGRAWPDAPPIRALVDAATAVLLVARPRLEDVAQLRARWRAARTRNRWVGILLVGQRSYSPAEVAAAIDPAEAPLLVWGVLPDDALGAEVLNGRRFAPPWGLRKSQLMRSARTIADHAAARLGLTAPDAAAGDGDGGRDRVGMTEPTL